jgi:peptidoglycan/xylan/chitin deacetylase (PgdA/CDA1 family)
MSRRPSHVIKQALLRCGYYGRRLRADRFPGVAVLCYHGVRDDTWPAGSMAFEALHVRTGELAAHCRVVRELCHPITLAQWRAALQGGPALPPRPVLLTFDDGYRTVRSLAQPILARYGVPAAVFVCTEPVQRGELFWHDAVARHRGEAAVEAAKALAYSEWEAVRAAAARPTDDGDPHAPLTIADVQALANAPGIEIGAHSASHAILARATPAVQAEQIARSQACLEQWIGRSVTAFAYPNGRPGIDYTAETVALVKARGFECAFTTRDGFVTPDAPALERSRFLMLAGISAAELAHRLAHSWRR